MADFDLVPANNGDLVPADAWQLPVSAPPSTTVENVDQFSPDGGAIQFFGYQLPEGATPALVQQAVGELAKGFTSQASRLGISSAFANQAAAWFKSNALAPLPKEWPNHRYRLNGYDFGGDENTVTAFLNYAASCGATQREVEACLYWVNQIGQQQPQNQPQNREYTDQEWAALERKYADDAAKAEAILRREWGFQYESNLAIADRFLNNMQKSQREHIANDVLADGTSALNSPDVVMFLFQQAIGVSTNISGAGLVNEINRIEKLMRDGSPEYWKSEETQSLLRHLYDLRG